MKNMIFALAAVLVLFGCVTPEAPEANETVESVIHIEVPIVEEEGPVESFSVESVDGVFPIVDYEFYDNSNPFSDGVGGDLGKTSTAYIKIDEDGLAFLSGGCSGEQQAFWFNLQTKDGKGVIFEAVYSVDLEEECETVKFLGKEYEIETVYKPDSRGNTVVRGGSIKLKGEESTITLSDKGSFNNDDKWPVVLGWKDGKLVKIIVYMGGYFYDIEADTNVVPLFGAGNSVLARFTDMESNPEFELITTDMTKVESAQPSSETEELEEENPTIKNSTAYDEQAGRTYEMNETINDSGIYLEFQPSVPLSTSDSTNEDYLTELHGVMIPIYGKEYALSCLEFDAITNKSKLCLADEESRVILSPYTCFSDNINASGKRFGFIDFGWIQGEEKTILCEVFDNGTCTNEFYIHLGENWQIPDNGMLHLWRVAPGYTFCAKWIEISYFSDEIELEDDVDGIKLNWTEKSLGEEKELMDIVSGSVLHSWGREEKDIPGLKSIYIPANSSAYEKLTK